MDSVQVLAAITRKKILAGHSKIAPIETKIEYLEPQQAPKQKNFLANEGEEFATAINAGPATIQHPDFIKLDGLPSPFLPEQNEQDILVGDPVLYANEANKEKLAHKLGLSKDALEDKLKHQMKLKAQLTSAPRVSFPRPRPGS